MMRTLLLRLLRGLRPVSVPETVMGTRPGFVWDDAAQRWVDEEETWKPGVRTYSVVGPVYTATHGHP